MKDNNRMISFLGWMLARLNSKGGELSIRKDGYYVYISKPELTGKEVLEVLKDYLVEYGICYGVDVFTEDLVELEEGLERILDIEEYRVKLDITNYEFKW